MNNGILAKGDDSVAMPYGWPIRMQRPDRIMPLPLGGSFDPRSIPGLHFWVDATNAASIVQRTGVARFESVSGVGVGSTIFSQSVANNQPRLGTMGGRPALIFDGNDYMNSQSGSSYRTLGASTSAISLYLVLSRSLLSFCDITGFGFGGTLQIVSYNSGNISWVLKAGDDINPLRTQNAIPAPLFSLVYPNAVGLRWDIANAQYSSSINGTLVRNRAETNTVPTAVTSGSAAVGEGFGTWGTGFVGAIGEMFGYKRFLTDAEDAALGLYLRAKWGS